MSCRRLACLLIVATAALPACGPNEDAIRTALEERYEDNQAAFAALDSSAVMAIRHPEFHTIDDRGVRMNYTDFAARTGHFLSNIVHFDSLSFRIDSLEVRGDTALAMVRQRTARQQRLPDGTVHLVQTSAYQREWWIKMPPGWMMYRVDRVHHDPLLVDGQPWPSN